MATPKPGVWGIDLGQCALKAIRLEEIDGQIKATAFDYIEHPKILSQPDADPDQLTREALEQFLSRNKLKGDIVVISVPGQTGLARFVKLPPVEEKKIADIVKFEAKQQIPFPLEEVVWDFQKIGSGEVTDGFALETEIGLFAMKRDMVNRAIQQFKEVGVETHVVQMAPLSLCNFVAYEQLGLGVPGEEAPAEEGDRACVVALEIGTDNSNLIITDGGKIIWQRPIPLGGNHFTRALTKDLKLTFAKAEHLKRNAIKSPDLKKILASLKTVLNDFVGEVQRSLGYFTNTHRNARIDYMLGMGNAFRLPGLQKYLAEKLQLEVRKLNKLNHISGDEVLAAPQFTENILTFGVAAGLALQGLNKSRIHTNLLPQEIRFERLVRAKKPWAAAAVAALLLAIAGITFASSLELKKVDNKDLTDKQKAAQARASEAAKLDGELKAEQQRIEDSKNAIKMLGGGVEQRLNWRLLFQYINTALPRADGSNLTDESYFRRPVYKAYYENNANAQAAQGLLDERRLGTGGGKIRDLETVRKEERIIKENLVQINIEGVNALFTEDLGSFFQAIPKDNELRGMIGMEAKLISEVRGGKKVEELRAEWVKYVPKAAWVVEIRGYTYHHKKAEFVEDTILENLARASNMRMIKQAREWRKQREEAAAKKTAFKETDQTREAEAFLQDWEKVEELAKDRIKFLMMYQIYPSDRPKQGGFDLIGTSQLRALVEAKAAGVGKDGAMPPPVGGGMPPVAGDPMRGGMPDPAAGSAAGETKPDRSAWVPISKIAAEALGAAGAGAAGPMGPPGGGKGLPPPGDKVGMPPMDKKIDEKAKEVVVPRTEFIILLVWEEKFLGADAAAAATPKE